MNSALVFCLLTVGVVAISDPPVPPGLTPPYDICDTIACAAGTSCVNVAICVATVDSTPVNPCLTARCPLGLKCVSGYGITTCVPDSS